MTTGFKVQRRLRNSFGGTKCTKGRLEEAGQHAHNSVYLSFMRHDVMGLLISLAHDPGA